MQQPDPKHLFEREQGAGDGRLGDAQALPWLLGLMEDRAAPEDFRLDAADGVWRLGMAEGRVREVGFASRGVGIGMRNVRERLEVLYGNSARFEVLSRPGRGTRVIGELPCAL